MSNIQGSIITAGRERKTLKINYVDKKGDFSQRETEPYEIKDGKYYGYCLTRGSIRAFTLNNISSAEITSNSYSPRWPVNL